MVQKLSLKGGGSGKASLPRKLKIGLTGGFGTGKSTVARLFKKKGTCVIDADTLAKETLRKGHALYSQIRALFKENASKKKQKVDRKKMAKCIFEHAPTRKKLESIVHPYVLKRIQEEVQKTPKKMIALEIPLLFEVGFDRLCHKTVVVACKPAVVTQRLLKKGFSRKEIRARQRAQLPMSQKLRKADFILNNSTSLSQTKQAFKHLWRKLEALSKGVSPSW